MHRLIGITGLDGCGKQTQSKMLYDVIKHSNKDVSLISFPNYESQSSALVNQYLHGEIVDNQDKTFSKAKIMSYALDRYNTINNISNEKLRNNLKSGIVVFDRYTTCNILHVASMADTTEEIDELIDYIIELEYNELKLPQLTDTLYLHITPEVTLQNINKRGRTKDVNETADHLYKVYENSQYIIHKLGWTQIECMKDEVTMKSPLEIHINIVNKLKL